MRILTILFFSLLQNTQVQKADGLLGLWVVEKVTVGKNEMTPVARWFEFKEDFTHRGGNGWQQNTVGTYSYNEAASLLSTHSENAIEDEYGPFLVSIDGNKMTWVREEDGVTVIVALQRAGEIPPSYADQATGLWKIIGQGELENATLYLRWDRRYIFRNTTDGNQAGVWNPHAHRPEIRLLSDQGDTFDAVWEVRFDNSRMIWEHEERRQIFERITHYPKD